MPLMDTEQTAPEHTQVHGYDRYILIGKHRRHAAFEFLHHAVLGDRAFRKHANYAAAVKHPVDPVEKLLHLLGLVGVGYFQSCTDGKAFLKRE